jgi:hypothetical protein
MKKIKRIALALLLVLGCTFTSASTPINIDRPYIRPACRLDMGYIEFIARADIMVEKTFPEWYVKGTPYTISSEEIPNRYASAHKFEDGSFLIAFYDDALNLCTVEDMAVVILHEHVHVKIWNDLEEAIPEETCNSAVHEMTAYGVEIEQTKIQMSQHMIESTQYGYNLNYLRGVISCPADTMVDFPWPVF